MAKEIKTIGLPRALLYHRYGSLWESFFSELGIKTILSQPSNRALLERGSALAIDESCLSFKLFLGHVDALLGKCDAIFIPRYSNYGRDIVFCMVLYGLCACSWLPSDSEAAEVDADGPLPAPRATLPNAT